MGHVHVHRRQHVSPSPSGPRVVRIAAAVAGKRLGARCAPWLRSTAALATLPVAHEGTMTQGALVQTNSTTATRQEACWGAHGVDIECSNDPDVRLAPAARLRTRIPSILASPVEGALRQRRRLRTCERSVVATATAHVLPSRHLPLPSVRERAGRGQGAARGRPRLGAPCTEGRSAPPHPDCAAWGALVSWLRPHAPMR